MKRALVLCAVLACGASAVPAAGEPGAGEYAFPIKDCTASYGRTHHDYPASDVFAKKGCAIVSVTGGVVDEVSHTDTWSPRSNEGASRGGLSVSVIGEDGVRYYYSHLASLAAAVTPGAAVSTGQRLGTVGRTGSARGTSAHLHFGLSWPTEKGAWWIRRGMVAPAPYLDAWRAGKDRSPAKKVDRVHREAGDLPRCDAAC